VRPQIVTDLGPRFVELLAPDIDWLTARYRNRKVTSGCLVNIEKEFQSRFKLRQLVNQREVEAVLLRAGVEYENVWFYALRGVHNDVILDLDQITCEKLANPPNDLCYEVTE